MCSGVCVKQGSPLDSVPGEAQMYFMCVCANLPFWVSYFNDSSKVLIDIITQKNFVSNYTC